MNRRKALGALAASPLLAAPDPPPNRQYYELRHFQFRNGTQPQRANDFFSRHFVPVAKRLGMGPIGFFNPVFGENSPFLLALISYPAMADAEHLLERAMSDSEFSQALAEWHKGPELAYVRYENTLLRAFSGHPQWKLPAASKNGHIFELRTYESNNSLTLQRKIGMFNGGEMQIFERLGMNPVFFGEALIGSKMPHLTYMLAYEDMAAREAAWKAFGADPAWQKLRATPGLSDADIVSNISNSILRPTAYSGIR